MQNETVKPFPLAAFESMSDGQSIACVQGVITKLFQVKTGTNSVGPWSIQNAEIEADGVVLPVMFKDRDPLDQTLKGRIIRLTASHNKGITGLYVFDDDKNGVVTRKLKVTATATLDIIEPTGGQAAAPPKQQQQQATTSFKDPAPTDHGPDLSGPAERPAQKSKDEIAVDRAKQEEHDIREVRRSMIQVANLHLLARLSVENYEARLFKEVTGKDMSESEIQGATASVFIKCEKLGMHSKMPSRPFTKDELTPSKK